MSVDIVAAVKLEMWRENRKNAMRRLEEAKEYSAPVLSLEASTKERGRREARNESTRGRIAELEQAISATKKDSSMLKQAQRNLERAGNDPAERENGIRIRKAFLKGVNRTTAFATDDELDGLENLQRNGYQGPYRMRPNELCPLEHMQKVLGGGPQKISWTPAELFERAEDLFLQAESAQRLEEQNQMLTTINTGYERDFTNLKEVMLPAIPGFLGSESIVGDESLRSHLAQAFLGQRFGDDLNRPHLDHFDFKIVMFERSEIKAITIDANTTRCMFIHASASQSLIPLAKMIEAVQCADRYDMTTDSKHWIICTLRVMVERVTSRQGQVDDAHCQSHVCLRLVDLILRHAAPITRMELSKQLEQIDTHLQPEQSQDPVIIALNRWLNSVVNDPTKGLKFSQVMQRVGESFNAIAAARQTLMASKEGAVLFDTSSQTTLIVICPWNLVKHEYKFGTRADVFSFQKQYCLDIPPFSAKDTQHVFAAWAERVYGGWEREPVEVYVPWSLRQRNKGNGGGAPASGAQ
ncbi:hypothetical protein PRZ48_011338 [Zasmidium cellare]|uniref:Uncharacterized protein n=1 Tax=Zasmidium cellare TaxID=395010 RepID=A0ABR0E6E0_ZASCE|nr:hypothetical protein PRZ48_011338 [Zasmidium cellare]